MCGIAGIIVKKGSITDLTERVRNMVKIIEHRGPDGEGIMTHSNLALGHRRLAILDCSQDGHQPMYYLNDNLVITYNGEIYNYLELRKELESKGYQFRSHTDTEVILAAYAAWGEQCVHRFNGMWAFAILDKSQNVLFCSRDRFGVKPFYYTDTPEVFAFGSEIKQLLPFLPRISCNQNSLVDFLLTSITDNSEETFFNNIIKLQAGNNLIFSLAKNTFKKQSYYRVGFVESWSRTTASDAVEGYIHLLEDAIQLRLRSDVPVGTCLSGGLDSSTVASLASPKYQAASGTSFTGITAVSEQASNNEAEYASKVIAYSDMNWLQVKPSYEDFLESMPHVVRTQEEPFGSPSITMQYFVMKTARAHNIPVLLDGQGGDETLLGYEKYYGSHLVTILRKEGIAAFLRALKAAGKNNKKLSLMNAMKYVIAGSMAPLRYRYYLQRHNYFLNKPLYPKHLSDYSLAQWDAFKLQQLEIESTNLPVLLRYEDKNSMAHSIETRLPFLDYRVLEAALSISAEYKIKDGWSKWLLRKGMENRMPESIVWRKNKFGFEAPEAMWLQNHFEEMQETVLASPLFKDILNPAVLKNKYPTLDKRSQWRLYSVSLWEKTFGVTS